jgi:hypothetical protein
MAAEGLITFGELRERLAELEETCEVVRRELDALAGRMERAEQLERDLEALLEQTAGVRPEDLDELTGDQRNEIYRDAAPGDCAYRRGYAMRGVFRTPGLSSGP